MAEKEIFILYTADRHHTKSSKIVLGVFTISKEKLIEKLKVKYHLSREELRELTLINQTQGREDNFHIESFDPNTISTYLD